MTRAQLVLALAFTACSPGRSDDSGDTATYEPPEVESSWIDLSASSLRVDVTPLSEDLHSQTWTPPSGMPWSDLTIELLEPVTLSGHVDGYVPTPTSITVPGEMSPIEASIFATVPGTRNGDAATSSPLSGGFSLELTPSGGYDLAIVPLDPRLPFMVMRDLTLLSDSDESYELGESAAVYGIIADKEGAPVEKARVQLVEVETRIGGPVVETDETGAYVLQAVPGAVYDLDVSAAQSSARPIPHVVIADVWAGLDSPTRIDVSVGELAQTNINGRVMDKNGNIVQNATVRLTSIDLENAPGSLTLETTTDLNGRFSPLVLPGNWSVEVIPPYDVDLSPVHIDTTVTGYTDLDDIVLPDRVVVHVLVVNPDQGPVENASVTIEEVGFDGYTFSALTGSDGAVDLETSDAPISVTVVPPAGSTRAITHYEFAGPGDVPTTLVLKSGTPFEGQVTAEADLGTGVVLELRRVEDTEPFARIRSDADGVFSVRVDVGLVPEP